MIISHLLFADNTILLAMLVMHDKDKTYATWKLKYIKYK